MATVADYITLASALDFHQLASLPEKLPLKTLPNNINSSSSAILSFMIEIHEAKDVSLHVGIGPDKGSLPGFFTFNYNTKFYWCNLQHHWNFPFSKQDFLHVWKPSGEAKVLTVSNITLWFQVNV